MQKMQREILIKHITLMQTAGAVLADVFGISREELAQEWGVKIVIREEKPKKAKKAKPKKKFRRVSKIKRMKKKITIKEHGRKAYDQAYYQEHCEKFKSRAKDRYYEVKADPLRYRDYLDKKNAAAKKRRERKKREGK